MMDERSQVFFALVRAAMGIGQIDSMSMSIPWREMYRLAWQQSMTGVVFRALEQVPEEYRPSNDMLIDWFDDYDSIAGLNRQLTNEAARLTTLFTQQGRQTAILKGQANARLYPDPLSRQPGDIDIWIEGGRESVIDLLIRMGLMDERPTLANIGKKDKATACYHHIHLPQTKDGITVEVHFRPSSGNFNPVTNKRLQQWLEREMRQTTLVDEGFNVPTMRFALMMQLSHIQRHFFTTGIGLRQICDYYWLLKNSTESDRQTVATLLRRFGLHHTAGALMWILKEVLHLETEWILCEQNSNFGEWMLNDMLSNGNFGQYAKSKNLALLQRFQANKLRRLRLMRFDFQEMFWVEVNYWMNIIKTIPVRIQRRRWSLRDI